MSKSWSNLAQIVYKRTYARRKEDGFENWIDTVERAICGNVTGFDLKDEEIERLRYYMLNRKAVPAGRGIWYSGTDSHKKLGGTALNNCFFLTGEFWANLVTAQDLLMLGGGVGLSVEHRYISKLPRVKKNVRIEHKNTKDADFIVPDSREGWNRLTYKVLEAFFETGKSFTYSTICIRGNGEPIIGFGGTSSGPKPLIQCVDSLQKTLQTKAGKHVQPIDVADLICSIGEMVVSGNVRRSAIMIIGDCWDKEYLKAKRWDIDPNIPPQRAKANFSVICDDVEDLHPLFWKTYDAGEAFGIINRTTIQKYGRMGELRKDSAIGVNPCFAAGTMIMTSRGYFPIESLVGKEVGIWNGTDWQKIDNFRVTGKNQPVLKVVMYDGNFERITPYHVCILDNGTRIQAKELKRHMKLLKETVFNFSGRSSSHNTVSYIYEDGIEENVYCCTVEGSHQLALGSGNMWGNCGEVCLEEFEACNLQDIALPNIDNEKEFIEAAKLMHRWGKRVSCEDYHNEKINEIVHRNRRIGTGITGCLQSSLFNPEVLDRVYKEIQQENVKYSKELNISQSIRTTTIKPSGTISKILDVEGEGIHGGWSKHLIQRIRFEANDPAIPLLREAGHYMEPEIKLDGTLNRNTLVVDFYIESPESLPLADDGWDTWKQLDAVKMAQKYWSDNSISVSVYYERPEIPKIKEWLANNINQIKTISFLCRDDHGFKQAPKEKISKEQYEELSKNIKTIKLDALSQEEFELKDGLECKNGVCPIK